MDYNKIKKEYIGTADFNLDISLFEYGLIHKINEDGTYTFIYGTESDGCVYSKFDIATVNPEDIIYEYRESDLERVADSRGYTLEEWQKLPLYSQIYDLCCYYGYINIFGEDQYKIMTNIPTGYLEKIENQILTEMNLIKKHIHEEQQSLDRLRRRLQNISCERSQ